jgi:hypothetical protein
MMGRQILSMYTILTMPFNEVDKQHISIQHYHYTKRALAPTMPQLSCIYDRR